MDTSAATAASMVPNGDPRTILGNFVEIVMYKEACKLLDDRMNKRAMAIDPARAEQRLKGQRYQRRLGRQHDNNFWEKRITQLQLIDLDRQFCRSDSKFQDAHRGRNVLKQRIDFLKNPSWSEDAVAIGLKAARLVLLQADWLVRHYLM
ncbi:hypothetical protein C1H76_8275 [Elsinoe australis]|uniref:Uncharacterized protein n=1 Tax=Elsinoe australis TaxID=40998 RepID=A0A4U7AWI7_9PEZI|nr:hypothetical protein C1H76_8275 [Elsinoe australis]